MVKIVLITFPGRTSSSATSSADTMTLLAHVCLHWQKKENTQINLLLQTFAVNCCYHYSVNTY